MGNHIPHRCRQLLFQVLEMLRKAVAHQFSDWKSADDWLFSELDITKSELAQIYEGREVLYYDGSAVDDSGWTDKPLTKEDLVRRGGTPVWAIRLEPNVDKDVPRPRGWGIVPEHNSFRQYLHQDFERSIYLMADYGEKWIAFDREQGITRYENE